MTLPDESQRAAPAWTTLLGHVWAARRWIAAAGAGAFLIASAVMLIVPETYRARAVLLPADKSSTAGLAAMMLAQAGIGELFGGAGEQGTSGLYREILQSRTVADSVIVNLGLLRDYELDDEVPGRALEAARRMLESRIRVSQSLAGLVTIDAEHQTGLAPRFRPATRAYASARCAEIANAFVDQLNRVNLDRSVSRARQTRAYLERQIEEARTAQQAAAQALVNFQERHGAISIDDQTRLAFEAAAELQSRILTRKVELGLLRRSDSESSPRVRALRVEIEELERQIAGMEAGIRIGPGGAGHGSSEPDGRAMPLAEIPLLATQYGELLREVKIQEALIAALTQQFYEAKLAETDDLPTVHVLDRAVPPARKDAPRRVVTVLGATVLALIAAGAWAAASPGIGRWRRMSNLG